MDSATRIYQQASQDQRREQLILENVDFVRKILSTLTVGLSKNYDRENLESAGIVGLVESANSFDSGRGVAFRTFAYPRIRGAIIDEMRRCSPVSQQMLQQIGLIRSIYERLEPPVTPEMLAEKSGLGMDKVAQCLEAMRFMKPQKWNDLFCTVHGSWQTEFDHPGSDYEAQEMKQVVADCIERLPQRERIVLTMYFNEDLTLAEIGAVIGISESRASRNLASAKFRLKEMIQHATT